MVNGVVYEGSYDDNLYAVNASTGKKLWAFKSGNKIYDSPAVANRVVYVGSGGLDDSLYALNAATGKKLWSFTTGGEVYSSPAVVNGVMLRRLLRPQPVCRRMQPPARSSGPSEPGAR